VVRDLLIEAQPGEPAPRQVHTQLFHQFALAGDAVQIADQQNPQQQLRIDRRTSGVAIEILQLGAYEIEIDVAINQAKQMIFRNLIF
jgi:hypothetical protein